MSTMGDWDGTVPSIFAGSAPTGDDWAAILAELTALSSARTSYAAVWFASGVNPAIGNGTVTASYTQVGRLVFYSGVVLMGTTTTFGTGYWEMSLPVTAVGGGTTTGIATLLDSSASTASRPGGIELVTTTAFRVLSTTGRVDATNPFTWASGDEFKWAMTYEAA